ncbi:MAG: HlyC/CorC family transporter [Lachnospiraceae bacterium]|nr:HlyC/CorC family transporter [Lachnospiraceae bacterium]
MDDALWTVSIISFLVLLAVEVIYYGFGSAIQNLNLPQIREDAEENGNRKSRQILQLAENPEKYVNTVQVLITCIQLVIGGYFIGVFQNVIDSPIHELLGKYETAANMVSLLISGFVLLLVILTFGVMVPKKIGAKYAKSWAYAFIGPIVLVNKLLTPITGLTNAVSTLIIGILGIRPGEDEGDVTEEEILSMVNEGHEQGVLRASEAEMISNIFDFSDKEAKDIMTHRSNIIGIDGNMSLKEAVGFMLSEANSRYPVYIENFDHIIGIIHLKDACRMLENGKDGGKPIKSIRGLIREADFIPETRKIDILFKNMQSIKTHVVIVIDEYGQTSGLITMEDILEEIVGNIFDEYDDEEAFIEQKGEDCYEIDGLTPLDELGEELNIDFSGEDFETLNGLMISYLERIPEDNEEFDMDYDGYNFKVLAVENKTIKRVLVSKNPEKQEGEK